ncbi:MAG: orotidine-5'-phosphate decarboxylase, partial [Clostridia bacterium]|nr:orotidine-5'-phosphate decarboxylase [Clostridia bacterium]
MSFEILKNKIDEKNNPTVMGLDPKLDFIPASILDAAKKEYGDTFRAAGEAIFEFNRRLIDAAADLVPAVKPQSAFYEMYGLEGEIALKKTVEYARAAGLYVILDVKRNDIGSTAACYAKTFLGETAVNDKTFKAFPSDYVTVNGYLGTDGIAPFVEECQKHDKGIFVLVKT